VTHPVQPPASRIAVATGEALALERPSFTCGVQAAWAAQAKGGVTCSTVWVASMFVSAMPGFRSRMLWWGLQTAKLIGNSCKPYMHQPVRYAYNVLRCGTLPCVAILHAVPAEAYKDMLRLLYCHRYSILGKPWDIRGGQPLYHVDTEVL
jgi:hypothetical protein